MFTAAWEIVKEYKPAWTKNTEVWAKEISGNTIKVIACDKGFAERHGSEEIYTCFVVDVENEYIEDEFDVEQGLIEKEGYEALEF